MALLKEPGLSREPDWQLAMANAASGKMPLRAYFGI
jgi:hypothetical protein